MDLIIKSVSPKIEKSSNKILGYTIVFENSKGTYNAFDFYSVEDMKAIFGCNTERECLDLKGKDAVELKSYRLKDKK